MNLAIIKIHSVTTTVPISPPLQCNNSVTTPINKSYKNTIMKKYIVIAIMAIGLSNTHAFAQERVPTAKQDAAQKKEDKNHKKLNETQEKQDKKEYKADKKERKMHKKQRKANVEQRKVNEQIEKK